MSLITALLHENRFRPHWRLLLALLVTITAWFALTPAEPVEPDIEGLDKLDHLLAFGSMALSAILSRGPGWRTRVIVALALLGYGAGIELLQTQIPNRFADLDDLMADALGIAAGLLLATLLRRTWPARAP